jgi:hypothetical protein
MDLLAHDEAQLSQILGGKVGLQVGLVWGEVIMSQR